MYPDSLPDLYGILDIEENQLMFIPSDKRYFKMIVAEISS